jgi:hypothetical protein
MILNSSVLFDIKLHAGFLLALLSSIEDGGDMLLRKVFLHTVDIVALCPRR